MDNTLNNKRIAKNTILLIVRMLLLMCISLYTSRVILQILGIVDFGIYNIIGGLVTIFAFFTSSLSNTAQRYLNVSIGKGKMFLSHCYFRQSFTLLLLTSIIVVAIVEPAGLWFLYNKLVIPPERMSAAFWVFQFSLISSICSILQIVFVADIVANERMNIYAYLSLLEVAMRLIICYCLLLVNFDHLVIYGALLLVCSVLVLVLHVVYCKRKFKECSLKPIWRGSMVRDMGRFMSFYVYGSFAYAVGVQGSNILLNLFFGPALNASRGIALQIGTVFSRFNENFMTAVKPQMIKSYSVEDYSYVTTLIIKATRYSFLIMLLIAIPILFDIESLLGLWLGIVPDYTPQFSRLAILEAIVGGGLMGPLWIATTATGNIVKSQIYGRTIVLLELPICYFVLKFFPSPMMVMWVYLIVSIIYWFYCLIDVHQQLNLPISYYIRASIMPGVTLGIVMLMVGMMSLWCLGLSTISYMIFRFFVLITVGSILAYYLLDKVEREFVKLKVLSLIKKLV